MAIRAEITDACPVNISVEIMGAGPTGPRGPKGPDGKTAYEYAKENGYAGTEQEFAQAQADILNAKTEVEKAGATEVQKVATEGAKQVQEATAQANLAKQSADSAASKAQEVAESVTAGKQEIATAKDAALSAVQGEGSKQVQAVNSSGAAQVQAVNDAGKAQISAVQGEGTKQSKAVADAGAAQVQAVSDEGQKQVTAVQTEGQKQAEAIEAIESLLPAPTAQNKGKVPMVNPEGNGYELGEVVIDAYTKTESDKRYMPLAAGIKPTASGELVTLTDSAEFALQGLKICGKSTQDSVPTPENPIPIVSVGESGSVDAAITGKNVITRPYIGFSVGSVGESGEVKGIKVTVDDMGRIHCNGTATGKVTYRVRIGPLPKGSYTGAVFCDKENSGITLNWYFVTNVWGKVNKFKVDIKRNYRLEISIAEGTVCDDIVVSPVLVLGTFDAIEYVPPQSQSLPIPTPNSLRGIPAKSGGNYTDSKGQQWVCDEVDFARGKWVQRIAKIDSYNGEPVGDGWMSSTGQLTTGATVLYQLETPIEHDLFPELIAAYQKLHTYSPTTNLFASDNAGVEVQYLADTKNYVDSKLQALVAQYHANQAALLSLMPLETQATMIENDTDNILSQEGLQ